jgi:general secretion pathway protein L
VRPRDRIEPAGAFSAGPDAPVAEARRRLGRSKIGSEEIVLRLQPREVIQTRLSVPAAAGDVLDAVVRNQIERLAPWPADKALFAYEAAPSPDGSPTLDVRLAVAARSLVEGLVAELAALGFSPGVVDFGTDASAEPRLNLLAARVAEDRRTGRRVLSYVGLACLAAVLAGALGTVGVVQETRELDALNARLASLQEKAGAQLPSQASARRQAWLAAQRRAQPSMAVMLEALSRALPDDTWLNRLEVEQGTVRLAGNASNASALIGQIEASGHFADVQFAAPTTLAEGEVQESFTITARIVPGRKLN